MPLSGGGTLILRRETSLTGTLSIGTNTTLAIEGQQNVGAVSKLELAGGTLRYSGDGARGGFLSRPLELTNAGGRLEASGTGSLTVDSPLTVVGTGDRVLTLGGNYADGQGANNLLGNTFAGAIGDNVVGSTIVGRTSLVKEGVLLGF